mmetsp:Transcript_13676/g.20820  ORF Transcript_13676/g.20820 Transcript_13676/m.20820 type:complete len:302 (+) Transcript_13676:95-1000(+)
MYCLSSHVILFICFSAMSKPSYAFFKADLATRQTKTLSLFESVSKKHGDKKSRGATVTDPWVLLVDDEEQILRSVGQYLFDNGYQVTGCQNAEKALQICQRGRSNNPNKIPDLIVSDIRMPGEMDGLNLLRRIRENKRLQGIPVVLLTAKSQIQDRIAAYKAGTDVYLTKPFDPQELLSIVTNSIKRYKTISFGGNEGHNDSLVDTLQQDIKEIKSLLVEQGGVGVGNGWVSNEKIVFLAPDERKVLEKLCEGLTIGEIGEQMSLLPYRVQSLISILIKKTGSRNRYEVVRWAISSGQIDV